MRHLGASLKDTDFDRMFRMNLNLLRIESLRYWFSDSYDSQRTMLRLQEIAFYNAAVLCRIHNQLANIADFDRAKTTSEKLVIMCQVFAVHSIINSFGKKHAAAEKAPQFVLCNDNLNMCI